MQNDHIAGVATRVVVPLRTDGTFWPRARRLNPVVMVAGQSLVLDTAALGAVPCVDLRQPVTDLKSSGSDIPDALDTLFGAD